MTETQTRERLRVLTFRTVNYILDLFVFSLAFILGFATWWLIKVGGLDRSELEHLDWISFAPLFLIYYGSNFFYLAYYKAYHSSTLRSFSAKVILYVKSVLAALLLAVLVAFLFPFFIPSRIQFISATGYAFVLLLIKEHLLRTLLGHLREQGYGVRFAVVVGSDIKLIKEINAEFARDHMLGLRLIGVVLPSLSEDNPASEYGSLPVLGTVDELEHIVDEHCVGTVIIFGRDLDSKRLESALWQCEERGLEVWVKLDLLDRIIYSASIDSLTGVAFVNFQGGLQNSAALFVKYTFDRIISCILLVILAPLFLLIAILVKRTSPGPVLFKQFRGGLHGQQFVFYKFRSMVEGAEEQKQELLEQNEMSGPAFKLANDPRVTPLGRILRKTSLDELPQLWNVFKGELSLVGPRPLPLDEVSELEGWHRRRLSMKPGITGSWQVAGRSKVVDFDQWARMDLDYIDSWSLGLDFVILLKTIPAVLLLRGAK